MCIRTHIHTTNSNMISIRAITRTRTYAAARSLATSPSAITLYVLIGIYATWHVLRIWFHANCLLIENQYIPCLKDHDDTCQIHGTAVIAMTFEILLAILGMCVVMCCVECYNETRRQFLADMRNWDLERQAETAKLQ